MLQHDCAFQFEHNGETFSSFLCIRKHDGQSTFTRFLEGRQCRRAINHARTLQSHAVFDTNGWRKTVVDLKRNGPDPVRATCKIQSRRQNDTTAWISHIKRQVIVDRFDKIEGIRVGCSALLVILKSIKSHPDIVVLAGLGAKNHSLLTAINSEVGRRYPSLW